MKPFLCLAIASIVALMSGCANQDQGLWQDQQAWVTVAADVAASMYPDHVFDSVQIELLLGKPDFQGTVDQYRDRMMTQIHEAFGRYGDLAEEADAAPVLDPWWAAEAFMSTEVWVYDESVHFPRPYYVPFDVPFGGCARTGFSATVFCIQDGKVVSSSYLVYWEPLEYERAR